MKKTFKFFYFSFCLIFLYLLNTILWCYLTRSVILEDERYVPDFMSNKISFFSNFPHEVNQFYRELRYWISGDPARLIKEKKVREDDRAIRSFPNKDDSGYLLFSGLDSKEKKSLIKLIRISDGMEVIKWNPDWDLILKKSTQKKFADYVTLESARAVHPVLLDNGDIIFSAVTSLVKMSPCSSEPIWLTDQIVHHSVEVDDEGNIWAPSVDDFTWDGLQKLRGSIRDDAIAKFSKDGKFLSKISILKIFYDNNLLALAIGSNGYGLNPDPIHLNQISIAPFDTRHWQKGDLLISARHLSTVFLYRPNTNKIIWYKTGPWLYQHSARFVDDHRISIFSNNVVSIKKGVQGFLREDDINRVFLYDFDNKQVSEPYENLLKKDRPRTITQGRAEVLNDGGLFLEDTEAGRYLRYSTDKLMWSKINNYDNNHVGNIAWGRYIYGVDAEKIIKSVNYRCNLK
jgi:hypothetical protein